GQLERAYSLFQDALVRNPNSAKVHRALAGVLKDLGNIQTAEHHLRRALELNPMDHIAHGGLLFIMNYAFSQSPEKILDDSRRWVHRVLSDVVRNAAYQQRFSRLPRQGRRLRIGYVSGDFRRHAVSYFVESLFAHHERARIVVFAYSTHLKRDAVTERINRRVDYWCSLCGLTDEAAAERIREDQIDVLIDLSGHTDYNRLGLFARRAAPVQAHYLGFLGTTGLTEMDYWIGDDILTPPEIRGHFSETLWPLHRVWVSYAGSAEAPETSWQPAIDGTIWLGSFNNLGKLTPATIDLWARVLHAIPEAKLLLKTKALSDARNRQRVLEEFAQQGVEPERIELRDSWVTPDWPAHMAYYDRLDIALDPIYAVGGGTTTCDALWMGVPVITLVGDRMASRMTASMLHAIGLPEWIAESKDDYIAKVVALGRDVALRQSLRFTQRERMAQSPLCDGKGLALALEDAYEGMFDRWYATHANTTTSEE
ncbi:MAG: tetratricopeptide repeat protein, partial [Pseudomonadota bacterium]